MTADTKPSRLELLEALHRAVWPMWGGWNCANEPSAKHIAALAAALDALGPPPAEGAEPVNDISWDDLKPNDPRVVWVGEDGTVLAVEGEALVNDDVATVKPAPVDVEAALKYRNWPVKP